MKNIFNLITILCLSLLLTSCGGGGSSGSSGGGSSGSTSLVLVAPSSYPVSASTVTAYFTINNTSSTNATGLNFSVPDSSNYTGTSVTVVNGASNPCYSVSANSSCIFPVTIGANSHPGGFNVSVTSSLTSRLISKFKALVGSQATTTNLSANTGLINLPTNTESGANGITVLYATPIIANSNGTTTVALTGVVNSTSAGNFNTLNLTTSNGTLLNFSSVSGNSGNGLSNLAEGAIVTFNLIIPAGVTSYTFYMQTALNGNTVNQGTIANTITLIPATTPTGILTAQPSNFNLTTSYESQVITYTNTGNGTVSALNINPGTVLTAAGSNTCSSTLESGTSCTYTVGFDGSQAISGSTSIVASYNNGQTSNQTTTAQVVYQGSASESGLTITSGSNPSLTFSSTTASSTMSSQITLTNTGNTNESSINFTTLPDHFSLSSGSNNSCTLTNGINVTNTLLPSASCNLTLTYTNGTVTSSTSANLVAVYTYGANQNGTTSVDVTYSTSLAQAALSVSPTTQYFIIENNNVESTSFIVTVSNTSSTGAATAVAATITGTNANLFSILDNGCSSGTLMPETSCNIWVKFGPTNTTPGNKSAQLQISYMPYTGGSTTTISANLEGIVSLPNSVDMSVVLSANDGFVGGNGESVATAFALESGHNGTISLTYTNNGGSDAYNFTTTATLSSPWSLTTHGCDNVNILAYSIDTCTDVYTLNSSIAGSFNFSYTNISANWNDSSGNVSQEIIPDTGAITYANVFASPYVLTTINNGSSLITTIGVSQLFYVTYNLYGGYDVTSNSYTASFTGGIGSGMGFTSSSSCTVSSESASCSLAANSGTVSAGTTTYTIAPNQVSATVPVSSSPNPLNLTVIPTHANIYMQYAYPVPVESAGNGTESTPFEISTQSTNQQLWLVYFNNGTGAATNFKIESAALFSAGYTIESNGCNNITLVPAGSESGISACTIFVKVSTTESGVRNLSLESNSLNASWVDESGIFESQAIDWHNNFVSGNPPQNTVYLQVIRNATVSAYLSSESSGTPQIGLVQQGNDFYLYYTLDGGYPGESFVYIPTYNGVPVGVCTLIVGEITSCAIKISNPGSLGLGSVIFGGISGVGPYPVDTTIVVASESAPPSDLIIFAGLSNGEVFKNELLLAGPGAVVPDINPISMVASDANYNIYVSGGSSIYESVAGSWYKLNESAVPGSGVTAFTAFGNGKVYAGTSAYSNGNLIPYIYESIAGAWVLANLGSVSNTGTVTALAKDESNNLYVSIYNSNSSSSQVYESFNGAWVELGHGSYQIGAQFNSLAIDRAGNVYAGDKNGFVWKTTRIISGSSLSWTKVNNIQVASSILTVAVNSSGNLYAAGAGYYVYESVAGSWVQVNQGIVESGASVPAIVIDANNHLYAATANTLSGKVYESVAGAWQLIHNESPAKYSPIVSLAVGSGNSIYAGVNPTNTQPYHIQGVNSVFTSSGGAWHGVVTGAVANGSNQTVVMQITSMAIYNDTKLYVGTTNGSVYESLSGTWVEVNESSPDISFIKSVAVDNNGNLYAGTFGYNNGSYPNTNGSVFESLSGTWVRVNGSSPDGSPVLSIAIDSNNAVYAGTTGLGTYPNLNGGLYRAVAGSWVLVNESFADNGSVTNVAIESGNNNIYITTTNGYVYESVAGSWHIVGRGSPLSGSDSISSLTIDPFGNVYVGTGGGWVYGSGNDGDWVPVGNNSIAYTTILSIATDIYGNMYGGSFTNNNLFGGAIVLSIGGTSWIYQGTAYGQNYPNVIKILP